MSEPTSSDLSPANALPASEIPNNGGNGRSEPSTRLVLLDIIWDLLESSFQHVSRQSSLSTVPDIKWWVSKHFVNARVIREANAW